MFFILIKNRRVILTKSDEKIKKNTKPVKKTNNKNKKNDKKNNEGLFKRIKKELKLVKWPDKKEIFKYTISTLIFCIIVALFFVLLTYLLSVLKGV